jgi:hypothetical protein
VAISWAFIYFSLVNKADGSGERENKINKKMDKFLDKMGQN